MLSRTRRQQTILEILQTQPVESQEALRQMLSQRSIEITQATLSRDLREMGAVKTPRGYQLPSHGTGDTPFASESAHRGVPLSRTLASFLLRVEPAGNLVVLRTGPGHAQIVALEIDRAGIPGVVGCLAGDDTIFVATHSDTRAQALAKELSALGRLLGSEASPAFS